MNHQAKTITKFCILLGVTSAFANTSTQDNFNDTRSVFQKKVDETIEARSFVAFHDDPLKTALEIFTKRNHHPYKTLVLGGNAEASVQYLKKSNVSVGEDNGGHLSTILSNKNISTNFALKEVGLNAMVNLNKYMASYVGVSAAGNNMSPKIDDIFMLFGNTEIAPVYFTVGKSSIPYGVFSGGAWTGSLTKMLFKPNSNINASAGLYSHGVGLNLTVFKKDNHFSNLAFTASYDGDVADLEYKIQGGYISDVKGSGNAFNNPLKKGQEISRIGAVNFDASLTYNIFSLGAGWAQTTDKFTLASDNYAGAWYVSSSVAPEIYNEITKFSLSYHSSYNTGNIPIALDNVELLADGTKFISPSIKHMGIISVERPIYKNKIFVGSEYAYMRSYDKSHSHSYIIKGSFYF